MIPLMREGSLRVFEEWRAKADRMAY
jgi:hypothetical protein